MVREAQLRPTKNGPVVDGAGWFVLNARDSRWKDEGPLGRYVNFEGKRRFPQLGLNVSVLAVVLWIVLFIWLGLRTLRNGHGWMFFLGIFFPLLWVFGAFAGPADRPA